MAKIKEFYKRHGLMMVQLDFEVHLEQEQIEAAQGEIFENVKIIRVNDTVEFGFEDSIGGDEKFVNIEFGFGRIKISKDAFEQALRRYRKRKEYLRQEHL